MYLPVMEHACIRIKPEEKKYRFSKCKACVRIKELRKEKEEFEKMMATTIEWDEPSVLL